MLKRILAKSKPVQFIVHLLSGTGTFIRFRPILLLKQYIWFFKQYRQYLKNLQNKQFQEIKIYPCLLDNLSYTPLEPTYFFQDSWAIKHIYKLKPKHHYDVGSSAKTIGILSQLIPVTMVDIRPIELELDNLFFQKGSILELPFDDNSLDTISSLCVIEHIGLGRYGDEIDPYGSEKAIKELKRVVKIGGVIIFSIPVDNNNKIYFNAHRAFTRDYILKLFYEFQLLEEKYHYGRKMFDQYSPEKGFGTGLFLMRKK